MEKWLNAPNPFQKYEVSNYGRVRNPDGYIFRGTTGRYSRIVLSVEGDKTTINVHRIVALTFLGCPPVSGMVVHHKNQDTMDNRVTNLEWVTTGEHRRLQRPMSSKTSSRAVLQLDQSGHTIKEWPSIRSIPHDYSLIWLACQGRIRGAYGFKWAYANKELPGEEWAKTEFRGLVVEVSSLGRVRLKGGRITYGSGNPYLTVGIAGSKVAVHRLVALAFLPIPGELTADGLTVNHKNFNKIDNRFDNLEWATQGENNRHARDHYPKAKFRVRKIQRIGPEVIELYRSLKEASSESGVPNTTLRSLCKSGRVINGYRWSYADCG